MSVEIKKIDELDEAQLEKIKRLVEEGEQVDRDYVEKGLLRAELIAIMEEDGELICTATLKRPLLSYKNRVFDEAKATIVPSKFEFELGYIATAREFAGQKKCQKLLDKFFPVIKSGNLFATSRNDAMIHILKKYGFKTCGDIYKKDLRLLTYVL